jgi:hypothetical protein
MKTEQVNVRLSLNCLIGCGKLMLKQGHEIDELSMASIVRSTLEGLISWLENEGHIESSQSLTEDEVDELYSMMFNRDATEKGGLNFNALELLTEEKLDELAEKAREMANNRPTPPEPNVKTSTEEIETSDIVDPPLDVFNINRMDIANLTKMAPKDVLIIKCNNGIVEPEFIAAVEAIYTKLSPDLWGTTTAQQAVADLVRRHQKGQEEAND